MKTNEIIEKKLKKYSAVQLLTKLEKGNLPESEKEVAIEILEKRGQDVSKFKPVPIVEPEEVEVKVESKEVEKPKKTKLDLVSEVDDFVDTLIEDHRDGVYNEVMKALGGKFDSDIDELFENATEEQLKEALSFKKIKAKKEEPTQSKVQKKIEGKTEKTVESKKEITKNAELCIFKENQSVLVELPNKETVTAEVVKLNVNKKGVPFYTLKNSEGKKFNRTPDYIKEK